MTSTTPLSSPREKAFSQRGYAQEVSLFEANPYSCGPDKNDVNILGRRICMHPFPLLLESNWCKHPVTSAKEETMRKELRALLVATLLCAPIFGLPNYAADGKKQRSEPKSIANEVRHRLVMLPWYSVFDNLAYQVEGDKVTLYGQVTRPTLKSDAEAVVKSIEGVSTVVNNIEVLPPSPMDDQLRRALYRAIYGDPGLSRYSIQAVPSIHIIVKNGNVTLEGVVDSEADKNLAGIRANQVPNVFSVKNNLVVGN
jgi:hyperosmotically inducible protein